MKNFGKAVVKCRIPIVIISILLLIPSVIGYLNETDTRGKKRKAVVDTVAATIILQNYLDSRHRDGG